MPNALCVLAPAVELGCLVLQASSRFLLPGSAGGELAVESACWSHGDARRADADAAPHHMCRVSTKPVAAFSVPEVTGAKTSGHREACVSKYLSLPVMPNFILDK